MEAKTESFDVSRFTSMLINPALLVLFDRIQTEWFTKVRLWLVTLVQIAKE